MRPALNRAIFAQRVWDSDALTVLTTLVHVFDEAGDYEIFVRRGETIVHRAALAVGRGGAPRQLDLDLAALPGDDTGCGCAGGDGYAISEPGLVSFHVSRGTGAYSVRVQRRTERHKEWVLDNAETLPEGDLFAVVLVRPGTYAVVDRESGAEARITVELPRGERYRMDEPAMVELNKGFAPTELRVLAGRAVVFHCHDRAQVRVELVDETATASA
jgi:hypothetical protein